MVLYSAEQWRSKVYIIESDCNLQSVGEAQVSHSESVADSPVVTVRQTRRRRLHCAGGTAHRRVHCQWQRIHTLLDHREFPLLPSSECARQPIPDIPQLEGPSDDPICAAGGRALAARSRNFVFYAVNPAMPVYDAYLSYCRNTGTSIDRFGIIMTSSFSPIRI